MIREPYFDVAVVGGGPGGASSAFHLSQKGWRVALLDRSNMPRLKACGDGLGPGSVAMLEKMGLGPKVASYPSVCGVKLLVHGQSSCVSQFDSQSSVPNGLVIPRSELDWLVVQRSIDVGCAWYPHCRVTGFEFENGRVNAVRYTNGGSYQMRARFVVIADGGRSGLCSQVGIARPSANAVGYAVRGYFSGISVNRDLFEIYLPLTDAQGGRPLCGYGWVFPISNSLANVGVGFYPGQTAGVRPNLRELFEQFLGLLRSTQPGLDNIELEGQLIGGVLNSGLDPSRCVSNGAVLVGDAAGLVDPFTGEGIDTALMSGKLAAEALDMALAHDDPKKLNAYAELLEHRYRARFQMGDRFTKTYAFMWKVVHASKKRSEPLFDSVRRALFSYNGDADSQTSCTPTPVGGFRRSVKDTMNTIAGGEFPIFGRIAFSMQDEAASELRQAVTFWTYRLLGLRPHPDLVTLSGCLELAKLAHDIQTQVVASDVEDGELLGKSNRWTNSFAVMTGNYLLTKAISEFRKFGPSLTQLVAAAAARACAIQISASTTASELRGSTRALNQVTAEIEGLFCGLSARLSGHLADSSSNLLDRLERYGECLGSALCLRRYRLEPSLVQSLTSEAVTALEEAPECDSKIELLAIAHGICRNK